MWDQGPWIPFMVFVRVQTTSVWQYIVFVHQGNDINLTTFSLRLFLRRRQVDDNSHLLTKDDRVYFLENSFLQFSKYMDYPTGGYSRNICTSPVVRTVDFGQSRFSIGNGTGFPCIQGAVVILYLANAFAVLFVLTLCCVASYLLLVVMHVVLGLGRACTEELICK